jgi:hypothetical protein
MKLWKLASTVALGVFASGSGALQVNAATYAYQVDFIDKEVVNFNDFRQSFTGDTSNLELKLEWTWTGLYYFDSCTPNTTLDVSYRARYRVNGVGGLITLQPVLSIPDFICSTSPVSFTAQAFYTLDNTFIDLIVDDDSNFINFTSEIRFARSNIIGRTLFLENHSSFFNLFYNFDTTYLFNYFLSDQEFNFFGQTTPADWTFNSDIVNLLEYVYTTAGNDTYLIENSLQVDIGTTRKKYAINVDDVYFRGESVGAQFRTQFVNGVDRFSPTTGGTEVFNLSYDYYFLNTSNYQQNIADVPTFEFETQDCGSFLALNVPCFINNALAYIVNDAPVISDAFTLLNAGMKLGGQAFGIIGNFTTDNLFGVMILGGLGITAVRWFLKND